MSESSVPIIKHSVARNATRNILLRDVAHIDVDEVGVLGRPVERRRAAVLVRKLRHLLCLERNLQSVLLYHLPPLGCGSGHPEGYPDPSRIPTRGPGGAPGAETARRPRPPPPCGRYGSRPPPRARPS